MKGKIITVSAIAVLSFVSGVAFGPRLVSARAVQAQRREVKTTELLRTDLGAFCEGKEVIIQLNENGPGTSGKHYHPGHSFGWIIEGSEVTTIEGKPPSTGVTGEMRHEGPMEIHESRTNAPEKVILFRIYEKGKPATTYVP